MGLDKNEKGDLPPPIDPPKPILPAGGENIDKIKGAKELKNTPGFHVISEGQFLGTYETQEDAEEYVRCHLEPEKKSASIVEGHEPAEPPAESA